MWVNLMFSMLKKVLITSLCLFFYSLLLPEILPLPWNFPQFTNPPKVSSLSVPIVHVVHSTQGHVNYTILWIGEVCKEENVGIRFWKVKGFRENFNPPPIPLPPLLLSLAYILLPFFYFSYENYFTKSLRHFPTLYTFGEILYSLWN